MSRTEPELEWIKRFARDVHILELRALRIGPIFPGDPDRVVGMAGTPRRATKRPFRIPRLRKASDRVRAACLSCRWKTAGRTWRPVRRRLAEHVAKKHPKLARAS